MVDLAAALPQTQLVNVGDREADFFELFDEQRKPPCDELLIRAQHNRNIDQAPFKLCAAVGETTEQSQVSVNVPQQSAQPKKSKQKAKAARPGRKAELALRHLTIQLPAPSYCRGKESIEIQLIHALEENPPQGTKAVEWFLLTTVSEAVQLAARIGGHLGRKKDPSPGHQVMWRGYAALQLLCVGFLLLEGG